MGCGYGAWTRVWRGGVMYVYMAAPCICILFLADTCASSVHPVFNPVAPYGYMTPNVYLFRADIENPDLFVRVCHNITHFYEEQRQPSSGSALPKKCKSGPHCWGWEGSTQFAQQFVTAVTAPPLVGCVVWSLWLSLSQLSLEVVG